MTDNCIFAIFIFVSQGNLNLKFGAWMNLKNHYQWLNCERYRFGGKNKCYLRNAPLDVQGKFYLYNSDGGTSGGTVMHDTSVSLKADERWIRCDNLCKTGSRVTFILKKKTGSGNIQAGDNIFIMVGSDNDAIGGIPASESWVGKLHHAYVSYTAWTVKLGKVNNFIFRISRSQLLAFS